MSSKTQEEDEEIKKERDLFNDRIKNYDIKILKLNNELYEKEKAIGGLLTEKENTKEKMNEKEQKIKNWKI